MFTAGERVSARFVSYSAGAGIHNNLPSASNKRSRRSSLLSLSRRKSSMRQSMKRTKASIGQSGYWTLTRWCSNLRRRHSNKLAVASYGHSKDVSQRDGNGSPNIKHATGFWTHFLLRRDRQRSQVHRLRWTRRNRHCDPITRVIHRLLIALAIGCFQDDRSTRAAQVQLSVTKYAGEWNARIVVPRLD